MSERPYNQEFSVIEHLRDLQSSGLFLFHGSGSRIDTLEPRQAVSAGKIDGEPAVCAATDPDTAIYMALMDAAKRVVLASGESCRSGYSRDQQGDRFYATVNIVNTLPSVKGWVHILPRTGFTEYYEGTEMRNTDPVTPVEHIEVTIDDFMFPIETIDE